MALGVQANEAVVLKEMLEDQHNANQQGLLFLEVARWIASTTTSLRFRAAMERHTARTELLQAQTWENGKRITRNSGYGGVFAESANARKSR